jgi:hypothetical protein
VHGQAFDWFAVHLFGSFLLRFNMFSVCVMLDIIELFTNIWHGLLQVDQLLLGQLALGSLRKTSNFLRHL